MSTPTDAATTITADASTEPAVTITPAEQLANEYDVKDEPFVSLKASPPPPPAAAATVPPTAAAGPAKATTHPKYLVSQATDFGIPESVIAAVSPDVLGDLVYRETKKAMAEARTQSVAAARQGDAVSPPPPPPAPPPFDWGEIEEDGEDGAKIRRKVAEDELHPAIVNHIKKLTDKIAKLEAGWEAAGQEVKAQTERTVEQRLDAAFSTMERAFGKGAAADVKGTPAFARRKAVWMAMQEMDPEEKKGMTLEAALAKCAKDLFGVTPAAAAGPKKPKPPAQAVIDDWNEGVVNKPTNRVAAPQKNGVAKARSSVADYLDEIKNSDAEGEGDVTLEEFL